MTVTEREWLECTDPQAMLHFLQGKASDRKLRLFAVACCRQIWHLLTDERSRQAVEVTERFADEQADLAELTMAQEAAYFVFHRAVNRHGVQLFADSAAASASAPVAGAAGWWVEEPENTKDAAWAAALVTGRQTSNVARLLRDSYEDRRQTSFIHCIFGPLPFRPVPIDLAWRTPAVTALAQAIYDERAFDRLPILADALEDAGCMNADIIGHCRGPAPHTRGCFVIDLLVGKE